MSVLDLLEIIPFPCAVQVKGEWLINSQLRTVYHSDDFNSFLGSSIIYPDNRPIKGTISLNELDTYRIVKDGVEQFYRARVIQTPEIFGYTFYDVSREIEIKNQRDRIKRRKDSIIFALEEIVFELDLNLVYQNVWVKDESKLFYPREEIVGKSLMDLFPGEFGELFKGLFLKCIHEKQLIVQEYTSPFDQDDRRFECRISPVLDEKGIPESAIMYVHEITEKYRAIQIERETNNKLNSLMAIPNGPMIVIMDTENYDIKYVSPNFKDNTGFDVYNNQLNFDWKDTMDSEQKEILISTFKNLRNLERRELELKLTLADDSVKWYKAYSSADYGANGNEIFVVLVDINELKLREASLYESVERFNNAFDNATIGMAIVDIKGRVMLSNSAMQKMMGYTELELRGQTVESITYHEDLEVDLKNLEDLNQGKIHSYVMRKRYVHKSGELIWGRLSVSLVRTSSQKPLYYIAQVVNISEEVKAQEGLELQRQLAIEAANSKSEFLSVMSHEIRTPLNAVIGTVNMMKMEAFNPEAHKEYLDILDFSSQNLLSIVNDILDLNKIESGKVDIENMPFNLESLIVNVRKAHEIKAEENNTILKSEIESQVSSKYLGDSARLLQVLNNLVGNAVKFTKNGEVILKVRTNNSGEVTFLVQDNGIGISKDNLKHIFDPFTQGDRSTTRKFGGTGLGLAISNRLVSLMGGELLVDSLLGKGSTFHFTIPMTAIEQKDSKQEEHDYSKEKDLNGLNILVVEDNAINLMIATKFLEKWKARVDSAANGKESLDKFEVGKYDLILMDIQMPVMNGYDASVEIRKLDRVIPIIAFTASALNEEKLKMQECGINDYVLKPFNPEELFSKIVRAKMGYSSSSEA